MLKLEQMRAKSGKRETEGLSDQVVASFIKSSAELTIAIDAAFEIWSTLNAHSTYQRAEAELIEETGKGWCNFYFSNFRTPYIPIAAKGSWLITLHGAVLNDSGGYGMLGFGHCPDIIINTMAKPHVMANIMTASLAHIDFQNAIRAEIGQTRNSLCPYDQFFLMNSGSEANAVVDRIIDCFSGHNLPSPSNGRLTVTIKGSFHGRTFKPAVWGDSSTPNYVANKVQSILSAKRESLRICNPNDVPHLERIFAEAKSSNQFIELVVLEPVMGEGAPGLCVSPEFYSCARRLTLANNSFLLVDSVQAGFRCTGYFSIVDYPGFQSLPPPDFESWSKAVNGGQYPVSVVGMTKRATEWHRPGIYGNTMTGNPRACEIATTVLKNFSPSLRKNIVEIGNYAISIFEKLQLKYPLYIKKVTGKGLLYAVHLDKNLMPVCRDMEGQIAPEKWMRMNGIGVIHGGENALRFTPPFKFTRAEVDLQRDILEKYLEIHTHLSPKSVSVSTRSLKQCETDSDVGCL